MTRQFCLALMVAMGTCATSSAWGQASVPSSSQIEKQIADLQQKLAEAKIKEAKDALAAETAAKAAADDAKAKADKARIYLASIGQPQTTTAAPAPTVPVVAAPGTTTTVTAKPDGTTVTEVKYGQTDLRDLSTNKQKFGGIEFGIGIAFTGDLGTHDRIQDAIIDPNGIVRVTSMQNKRGRIVLESHYLFTPTGNLFGLVNEKDDPKASPPPRKSWGFGPFVALQPGSDNVIEALGAGLMLGLKRPGSTSDSFNIGIGIMYDLNTKVLGDGFVVNQRAPANETTVRFQTTAQSGLLIMTSYSF